MTSSPLWSDSAWTTALSDRQLDLHTPDAAFFLVERSAADLAARISEFNERTGEWTSLTDVALLHGHENLARSLLRRAADSLIGYGWRKDTFASEVLETLNLQIAGGDGAAADALLDLAGPFEELTEYTDGSETGHIRREYYDAIARRRPDRVAGAYRGLIRAEDWRAAESLMQSLVEDPVMDDAHGQALLETLLTGHEARAVQKIGSTGTHIASAASSLGRRLGIGPIEDRPGDDVDKAEPKPEEPLDPSAFPPPALSDFIAAGNAQTRFGSRRELAEIWLKHWAGRGRGEAALDALRKRAEASERYTDLTGAFDAAFDIALAVEGRTKAFDWLVRAHVSAYGWQSWWSSREEAEARFDKVATLYPERWLEFLQRTGRPGVTRPGETDSLVVGQARLVSFLRKVGQFDQAQAVTRSLAASFRDELSDQPISTPDWAR